MVVQNGDPHVGLVVEGPGDRGALPILLRKHLVEIDDYREILGKPITLKGKGAATTPGGIEGYVKAAARPGCVGVIVLLDADQDVVCDLGPQLVQRAEAQVGVPVVIAIADKDFEDWLYCSIETLALDDAATWEAGRRGKNVIESLFDRGGYKKPVWQPKLTHRVDLSLARGRSHSLNRLLAKLEALVALC